MKTLFKKVLTYLNDSVIVMSVKAKNIKEKIKTMRVFTPKKQQPNRRSRVPQEPWHKRHDIIGVLLVLLWLSTVYSSIAVWFNINTAGPVPKIMLAPQIIAAGALLVWKFTKK